MVQAGDRFRGMVTRRPWRRRRRALIAALIGAALLLAAAIATVLLLPALQVRQVTVEGTGYVQEETIREAVAPHAGGSMLLMPVGAIEQDVAAVPGVESVEAERVWPDGVRVSITETAPVALLTGPDGTTAVVDARGRELPAAAGQGANLVPIAVRAGSGDPDGAAAAMSEVLAGTPEPLRGAIRTVTASGPSDVTLELALADGGTKTVIWGDTHDAALKADVVQALLGQPGTVIDVSSPVAPVTR
ncbi:cell division protein FtsQ/DivIB [Brachybacterium sp. UNK5269]|uniref:cell division protein FtsQ/DivIB n=1 Tax=Brachybacterium sp. UNK5269 TaxID=3408576 RepID=UPI003BB17600